MYCEGLFELFGTSSKEIADNAVAKATAEANAIIAEQAATIAALKAELATKQA